MLASRDLIRRGMCEMTNQNSANIKGPWDEYKFFLQVSLKKPKTHLPKTFNHVSTTHPAFYQLFYYHPAVTIVSLNYLLLSDWKGEKWRTESCISVPSVGLVSGVSSLWSVKSLKQNDTENRHPDFSSHHKTWSLIAFQFEEVTGVCMFTYLCVCARNVPGISEEHLTHHFFVPHLQFGIVSVSAF